MLHVLHTTSVIVGAGGFCPVLSPKQGTRSRFKWMTILPSLCEIPLTRWWSILLGMITKGSSYLWLSHVQQSNSRHLEYTPFDKCWNTSTTNKPKKQCTRAASLYCSKSWESSTCSTSHKECECEHWQLCIGKSLLNAAWKGHLEIVRFLLSEGADFEDGVQSRTQQNL